jgi:hypothetical protein
MCPVDASSSTPYCALCPNLAISLGVIAKFAPSLSLQLSYIEIHVEARTRRMAGCVLCLLDKSVQLELLSSKMTFNYLTPKQT